MSIDIDPRPGRPRTSTDERSVKLVADVPDEDRRATREVVSRVTGAKIISFREIKTAPPSKLALW